MKPNTRVALKHRLGLAALLLAFLGIGHAPRAIEIDVLRNLGTVDAAEPSAMPEVLLEVADAALREAYLRTQRGDFDGALAAARQAVATNPKSAPAAELVGVALAKQGHLEEALRWFQRAIHLDPQQGTALTKIGDVHLGQQHWEAAKAAYLRALQVNSMDRRAHQRLGLLLEQEGDFPGAVQHYERGLVGAPPDYVGIKVNLGRLYNEGKAYDRTVAMLAPVVPATYPSAYAHLVLGTAYLGLNRTAEALAVFERMQALEPGSRTSELALSVAQQRAGDAKRALETVERLIQRQPDFSQAYSQRAEVRLSLGQTNLAMADYTRALETTTQPGEIRHRMAEVWMQQGQDEKAIEIYRTMLNEGAAAPSTYDRLALLHQLRGEYQMAEETLDAGSRAFPQSGLIRLRLGLLYGFTQQYQRCRDVLLEADRLSPGDPRVGKALVGAYLRLDDRAQAILRARQLVQLMPDHPEERFFLGGLLEEAGDYDAAIQEYRQVLTRDPKHVPSLNNLASALLAKGKPQEALVPADEAVRLAPNNATIRDTQGWVQYRLGRFEEARQSLEHASRLPDARPTHLYHLGLARLKTGDRHGAIEALERSLADPSAFPFPERAEAERTLASLR